MRHRSLRSFWYLLVYSLFLASSWSLAGTTEWEWIPKGRPFVLAVADPREVQMGLAVHPDSRIMAYVGNYFSVLGLRDEESNTTIHFGLEGQGVFGMKQAESRFPLETTDGIIGLYAEGSRGPYQLQLRYTHLSSHLADGSTDSSIAFSREYASLRAGYSVTPLFHVYAGVGYILNSVPIVKPASLQMGSTAFLPWRWEIFAPFAAFDIKYREESAYNPSLSLKLGIALNNPTEAYRSFRFFYSYYTGADPRGQYFNRTLTAHSLGIEMQI